MYCSNFYCKVKADIIKQDSFLTPWTSCIHAAVVFSLSGWLTAGQICLWEFF